MTEYGGLNPLCEASIEMREASIEICHDSRDDFYRHPFGALRTRDNVRLRVAVNSSEPPRVRLRVWANRETWIDMREVSVIGDARVYEHALTMPAEPCLVWYDFRVIVRGVEYTYGNAYDKLGGVGAVYDSLPPSFQITVYDESFEPPEWMRAAVMYQIFPDRFRRAGSVRLLKGRKLHDDWYSAPYVADDPANNDYVPNDFYGGTLRGITEKLPYIARLGANVIYLNPIFFADSNHRYDTNDYTRIDPMLGTEQDFTRMCEIAARLGIRVILDGVFSHMGSSSERFKSAATDERSPYHDWFIWKRWPDSYECWWNVKTLPNINEDNETYRAHIMGGKDSVVQSRIIQGASGWRLDVADELPLSFLRELRVSVKGANANAAIIGEVWENASCKITYGETRCYCLGDTVDSVMNYPLRTALVSYATYAITANDCARQIMHIMETYPRGFAYSLMNLLGSHDMPRILNTLVGVTGEGVPRLQHPSIELTDEQYALAKRRLKMLFSILCAWPGMPCVYYGDEAGLTGVSDPFNRRGFPWGREDEELTRHFMNAIALRRQMKTLTDGDALMFAPSEDVLGIYRHIMPNVNDGEPQTVNHALLLANRTAGTQFVEVAAAMFKKDSLHTLDGDVLYPSDGVYRVSVPPCGAVLYI